MRHITSLSFLVPNGMNQKFAKRPFLTFFGDRVLFFTEEISVLRGNRSAKFDEGTENLG